MALLSLMRYRYTWWPFHPIGFTLSGTIYARLTAFTIFLAWLAKFLMIKLAGPAFYRRSKPFFVGMLIGHILIVVVDVVVDMIWFPASGHILHSWH